MFFFFAVCLRLSIGCISPNVILIRCQVDSESINTILPLLKALTLNQKIAAVSTKKTVMSKSVWRVKLSTFLIYLDFNIPSLKKAIKNKDILESGTVK